MLSLVMCVHLFRWRNWPPYVTKSVNLVIITVSELDVVMVVVVVLMLL